MDEVNERLKAWLESEITAVLAYGGTALLFGVFAYWQSNKGVGWGSVPAFAPFAAFGIAAISFVLLLVVGEIFPSRFRPVLAAIVFVATVMIWGLSF